MPVHGPFVATKRKHHRAVRSTNAYVLLCANVVKSVKQRAEHSAAPSVILLHKGAPAIHVHGLMDMVPNTPVTSLYRKTPTESELTSA